MVGGHTGQCVYGKNDSLLRLTIGGREVHSNKSRGMYGGGALCKILASFEVTFGYSWLLVENSRRNAVELSKKANLKKVYSFLIQLY